MKKNIIIYASILLVIAIVSCTYFIISKRHNDITTNTPITNPTHTLPPIASNASTPSTATTAITSNISSRLLGYPYYEKVKYNEDPVYGFSELSKERPNLKKIIMDGMTKAVKFEPNEKFFTNENLCYVMRDWNYVVRGVLQTKNTDGTLTEQDIEIQFWYGKVPGQSQSQFYYKEMRNLSEKAIVR